MCYINNNKNGLEVLEIRKVNGILRLFCGIIDYIIIILPVQVILMFFLRVPQAQIEILFKFLYAVYGVILIENFNGATIGKWFGKIKIISKDGGKPTMIETGIRELVKTMYFIPYIGWLLGVINCMLVLLKVTTLHEFISNSKVIYNCDEVIESECK